MAVPDMPGLGIGIPFMACVLGLPLAAPPPTAKANQLTLTKSIAWSLCITTNTSCLPPGDGRLSAL
jgi:hypothetical protein